MNTTFRILSVSLFFSLLFLSVDAQSTKALYSSETLQIKQITPHIFVHVSYLPTKKWGKVACNGMVYVHEGAAIVFDTPPEDSVSQELIQQIQTHLQAEVQTVVVNHFHVDCLGGLSAFHEAGIPSYAGHATIERARTTQFSVPQRGFRKRKRLRLRGQKIILTYPGRAHTYDNTVAYIPSEKALFGGCMVKSLKAGKGNLGDADVAAWPQTVARVRSQFPDVQYVVPGHGKPGGLALLDYTIQLFQGESQQE